MATSFDVKGPLEKCGIEKLKQFAYVKKGNGGKLDHVGRYYTVVRKRVFNVDSWPIVIAPTLELQIPDTIND